MQRLNQYMLRQLVGPFAFFSVALTGVIWLSQSLRFVDWIFNKGLSMGFFFYLTLLILPGVLAIVLPIALFASVIYAYHRLSAESELVVMSSSGVGPLHLARPALFLAIVVMLVSYCLTLYLMPMGNRTFRMLKLDLRANLSHVLLQEGTFNTVGSGLTVYIRERRGGGELLGILVHDSRIIERPMTMMAERGLLLGTENSLRLILVNGNRQEIEHGSQQLSMLNFERYTVDLSQFVKSDQGSWLDAKERYLHELFIPGDTAADRRNADTFRAEGHDRLASPLFSLTLTLLALAAVLAGRFDRRGIGRRVAITIAIALLVRLAGVAAVNLAAKSPYLIPLLYLNIGLPLIISWYLLARLPRRPRLQFGAEGAS